MARRIFLAFLSALLLSNAGAAQEPVRTLYCIETERQGMLWSIDHPLQSGEQVLFHQHPGGTLVSIRRSEIRRVTSQRVVVRPAGVVDIGVTAGGAGARDLPAGAKPGAKTPAGPGARPDGTALLNPDRKYQPDIDSKQVPGMNLAYPSSPNDYREGRTLAYPAPAAVQAAPGEPPKMPTGSGEVPKGPQ